MYEVKVRSDAGVETHPSLAEAFGITEPDKETWLVVAPHDDDGVIRPGMIFSIAREMGVRVKVAVVTDGAAGYTAFDPRRAETRLRETTAAYAELGINEDDIQNLGFPDGQVFRFVERRKAESGEPAIDGHTGLENNLTAVMRSVRPARVFTTSGEDNHPDHQQVNRAARLCAFLRSHEDIWHGLGQPCAQPPLLYAWATDVEPKEEATVMLKADDATLEKKLRAIECWESQKDIIAHLVNDIRRQGPFENLWEVPFRPVRADRYRGLFEGSR